MDIAGWRKQIDKLDRKLVEMLNRRARAAQEIGRLKRHTEMPIYEPSREKIILQNIRKANRGPFPQADMQDVFQRIIAVMRHLQREKIKGK